ncbi:LysR family transcriptional regulator [Pelagibacterium lentulum]|uniref:Transcriptional regulator n=1 Tax=Pelagibacterium lentulum TaxID=2029865 RepID=A0A916RK52_9HYPH|nr:LysR family transcriptional regulator [Pelagibacterium lentulum]GGA58901.1 transcriptional regulator [Pelagibacterium lentulum]
MTNTRSFDLNLLPVLEALLSEEQVSRAARRLNLSQPATSAALARLRDAFDDPLLIRDGRGMVPSHLARQLQPRLAALIAEIESVITPQATFDPATTKRRFTIAANDYAVSAVLSRVVARLHETAPAASVEILPLEEHFSDRLAIADFDLAIRDDWSLRSLRNRETLFHEAYVCIARSDHPRLSPTPTIDEFLAEGHVLIAPRADTSGPVDAALARIGARRTIAVTTPHFLAAPAMVAETDYVMTIARRIAEQMAVYHRLRLFEPPVPVSGFDVAMAWPAQRQGDPAVDWLRQQIHDVL